MLSLLKIWENNIEPQLELGKPSITEDSPKDNAFVQSSFEFDTPPKVSFINNVYDLKPVEYYDELESVDSLLTEEERGIVTACYQALKLKDKHFYDGKQLLITNLLYDSVKNEIYIEAKQARYSFLRAILDKKFQAHHPISKMVFYKTGVLVPFITDDYYTCFVKRKRDPFYSGAGGFLEPVGKNAKLASTYLDLITYNALKETVEEFLGIYTEEKELMAKKFKHLRINFEMPKIKSLSFRSNGVMGTIEFIMPCQLHCSKSILENIIKKNKAKDAHEHTTEHVMVPLESVQRSDAIQKLLKPGVIKYPGSFLYVPMLVSCSLVAWNQSCQPPHTLPYTRTRIISPKALIASPKKLLSTFFAEKADQNNFEQDKKTALSVEDWELFSPKASSPTLLKF